MLINYSSESRPSRKDAEVCIQTGTNVVKFSAKKGLLLDRCNRSVPAIMCTGCDTHLDHFDGPVTGAARLNPCRYEFNLVNPFFLTRISSFLETPRRRFAPLGQRPKASCGPLRARFRRRWCAFGAARAVAGLNIPKAATERARSPWGQREVRRRLRYCN